MCPGRSESRCFVRERDLNVPPGRAGVAADQKRQCALDGGPCPGQIGDQRAHFRGAHVDPNDYLKPQVYDPQDNRWAKANAGNNGVGTCQ